MSDGAAAGNASRFTITKPSQTSNATEGDVTIELLKNEKSTNRFTNVYNETVENINTNGTTEKGLFALYSEDIHIKGRFQSFLHNVSSYTATIPPAVNQGSDNDVQPKAEVAKLGTLVGVYLPCIQNILGVILFIRLSWIVGTAGVFQSFFIVFICCCCTMLTAISMSAIATNGVVPAGGSYFMISRSLGPEFGGAVGVLFYLGTSFASAMYILGAVEILLTYIAPSMSLFGSVQSTDGSVSSAMLNNMRVYGTILVILMGSLVFIGVKYVNKCASIFLACVLLSILAIFVGFFSIHARETPNICLVGKHLVSASSYTECSRNDTSLQQMYYSQGFTTSKYFNQSAIRSMPSIPGIKSDVFKENVGSAYKHAGEVTNQVKGIQGEIISDMTTSFTILLAIFFPSVTGIMAGSNRSGNLKNAQYSIPRGTIAAIITTSTIYLLAVVFFGATVQGELLRDKFGESIGGSLLASNVAWPNKWIILIGSLLSTIGAGLQSLTGAPRLLQAIANDGVIPFLRFFSVVSKDGEPKRALFLTLFISELGVLIASLDAVAPIITMFFLMCYGFVNFACTLQSLLDLPNWRPRFRFYHWSLSLLGMLICLALMFISSWYYALIAILIAGFLYKYIEYRGAEKEWGDGLSGLSLSAARFGLLRLQGSQIHTKNWRPQLLVLIEPPISGIVLNERSKKLISLASQLKTGRGLTIVGSVIEGDYLKSSVEVDEYQEEIVSEMKQEKVKGFCTAIASSSRMDGLSYLIQSAGLGALKPNTIVISWPSNWKRTSHWRSFIHSVRVVSEMKRAVVVVKEPEMFPDLTCRESGNIDIWWIVHDGGLMLLMMFLLKQHKVWKKCKLRVFTIAQITDNSIQIKNDLVQLMYNLRLTAEVFVIEMEDCDISAYTYERTLQAEQRKEMLSKIKLSKKQSKKEAQMIFDKGHRSRSGSLCGETSSVLENRMAREISVDSDAGEVTQFDDVSRKPNEENVRRMNTAIKINKIIHEKSSESRLIMINLPKPPTADEKEFIYMEFIEALIEGLKQVFLVRGGGHEVVTIYS